MPQNYDPNLPATGQTIFGELYQIIRDKDEALRSDFEGTSFPANPIAGQRCWRSDMKKWYIYVNDPSVGENGWVEIPFWEVLAARGSKPTLDQRLAVSLNDDGTLKANVAAYQSEWIKPSLTFTYLSSTSFKVNGDQRDIYTPYRRLKINHTTSATGYTHVVSVTYDSVNDETTIQVADAVIASDLVDVEHGIINADRTKDSLPRNVDADTLDTYHAGNSSGQIPISNGTVCVDLIADKVDGFDASQSPTANQIPVLNANGQLQLPFYETPILVDGQDLMYRTFYVDAVNGSDSNPGTSTAPFATLKKAIDSVPVGGYGVVNLVSDITLNQVISIDHKFIIIQSSDYSVNRKITIEYGNNGINNTVLGGIVPDFSNVKFIHCDFEFVESSSNPVDINLTWNTFNQFIKKRDGSGLASLYFQDCNITLSTNSNVHFASTGAGNAGFRTFGFYNVNIIYNSAGKLFSDVWPPYYKAVSVSITDSSGTTTYSFEDVTSVNDLSFASSGYYRLPSGLIIQWGYIDVASGSTAAVTFPIAFPNACLAVTTTSDSTPISGGQYAYDSTIRDVTTSGFTAYNISAANTMRFRWIAIGY